ncbi:uncharacterized protein [Periplaneta americana]|uniref:uncharacterized protein n=1 Tax=Periplaneta americana TaxID=6978 RepID=UPI0037E8FA0B
MLLFLALSLVAGVIFTSSNGCEVGPVPITNFDFKKFNGHWIWLYHTPSEMETYFGCLREDIIPQGDKSVSNTVTYNRLEKRDQEFKGFLREWNSTSYFQEFEDNVQDLWKAVFFVMGIDYEKYVVVIGCVERVDHPQIYVGFRVANPDKDTIEAANKTLQENGMSLKDLERFPDCDA